MHLILFLAACGPSVPVEPIHEEPVAEPASEASSATEEPEAPAPPEAHPKVQLNAMILRASIEGEASDIINEFSGQHVGVSILRSGPGPVHGVPCKAEVSIFPDSWGCDLTADHSASGHTSPAGEWLGLHYTGERRAIVFDSITPPIETLAIGGLLCEEFVHLHPDGTVHRCALAKPHTTATATFPKQSELTLRLDGSVEDATIHEAITIAGVTVESGYVEIGPDGKVTSTSPGFHGD